MKERIKIMPDKRNVKQEELAEQGWSQMAEILDRKMPQQRKRRKAFWIPFGAIAVTLIAMSVWLLVNTDEDSPESVPESKSATAEMELHTEAAEDDAGTSGIVPVDPDREARRTSGRRQHDPDLKDADHQGFEEIQRQGNSISKEQSRQALTSTAKGINNRPALILSQSDADEIDGSVANPLQSAELPESQLSDEAVVNEAGSEVLLELVREPIVPASVDPLAWSPESRALPLESGISPMELEKNRFAVYALVNSHFNDAVAVRGLEGGIALGYDVSQRISLIAGLTFGYYADNPLFRFGHSSADQSESLQAVVPDLQDTSANVTQIVLANAIFDNTIGYDTARILTHKYQYLHLPVAVYYQLNRGIQIGAGVRLSRLISAPSEYGIGPGGTSFGSAFNPVLNRGGQKNFLYKYDIVRKHDIAPMLSAAIRLGRQLTVDIAYQHGLVPLIAQSDIPDRNDFNRTLSLGLRYRLF